MAATKLLTIVSIHGSEVARVTGVLAQKAGAKHTDLMADPITTISGFQVHSRASFYHII